MRDKTSRECSAARSSDCRFRAVGGGENDGAEGGFCAVKPAAGDERVGDHAAAARGGARRSRLPLLVRRRISVRRARGEFLESFEVFGRGHWYGTLHSEVAPRLAEGKWVVLEIDVQGADAVVRQFPDAATFFLRPSSAEELERRLRARGTESAAAIARRLETARRELSQADRYEHQIINDDIERAVTEMCRALDQLTTDH